MATDKDNPQGQKEATANQKRRPTSRKSKFLSLGKYFLLILLVFGQGFVAYKIVDSNYATIYEYMHKPNPAETGTYQMEDLVVNPAGTNGRRFLLVQISLELGNKEHVSLLESNKMKLRQDMIDALSARTVYQLTDVDEREVLRSELARIINEVIGTTSVRNLYFTKYVMQ